MNNDFLILSIGYNSNNLLGSENDAVLFYNLNFSCEKHLLLGQNATLKNLNKILNSNIEKENIVLFFSGHGFKGGCLNLADGILKPIEIYDIFNFNFKNQINLHLILDCCYSGGFPQIKNFNKIKNTFILASCDKDEKSGEIITYYNDYDFKDWKPLSNKKNIILGLFTYNFIKIIKSYNLFEINKWFIEKHNIYWEELGNLSSQKIIVKN